MKKIFLLPILFFALAIHGQGNPTPFDNSIKVKNLATELSDNPDFGVFDSSKTLKKKTWSSVFATLSSSFYPAWPSNPAGYLTNPSTLEFENLAAFPHPGLTAVVYIAQDTGFAYSWNGSNYVAVASTGVSGIGIINRIPMWTAGNVLGNSGFSQTASSGRFTSPSNPDQFVSFLDNAVSMLTIARAQSNISFSLGNPGFQDSWLYSSNAIDGFSLWSEASIRFNVGTASGSGIERARFAGSTGFFGVGVTNPTDRVHVNGNLRVTGGYKDSSNNIGSLGQVLTSNGSGTAWVAPATIGSGTYVQKSGDVMTGDLVVLTDPPTANSAASRNFVETLVFNMNWKTQVKCSTTVNHSLSGTSNVDGVTIPSGTRVLVRFQTSPEQNGIWISASGSWTRASDCDSASEIENTTVSVTSGTLYGKTIWIQNLVINTINVDPVGFTSIPTAGAVTADGTYLSLISNVFSINPANTATVSTTQTFQNKTISGSNNTFANIAQGAITNLIADLTAMNSSIATNASNTAANTSNIATNAFNIANKENKLTITTVKTGSYNASANDFVPFDLSGGNGTLIFPNAPTDGTKVGGKIVILSGTNVLNLVAAGTDVFNITGGSNTGSLSVLNQVATFQYKASLGIWYAVDTSLSLTYVNSKVQNSMSASTTQAPSATAVQGALDLKQDDLFNSVNSTITIVDEFGINTTGIYFTNSNSGGTNSPSSLIGTQGVLLSSTGTGATNAAGVVCGEPNTGSYYVGSGAWTMESYINIPTLSNSTDRYNIIFGLTTTGNYTSTQGIFFLYDEGGVWGSGAASPNWKCATINSGGTTFNTSTIPVSSGFTRLRLEINAAGTSVQAYVNGVAFGSANTTNIPTSAMSFRMWIVKRAGTNSRTLYTDFIKAKCVLTTAR